MSGTQTFVKRKFDDYFERLGDVAQSVEELKQVLNSCPPDSQQRIRTIIASLENELRGYAEELKSGGTEIIKRVA